MNFEQAKVAFIKQGQQPELVQLATARMIENVRNIFTIPLKAAGLGDVQVKVNVP